MHTTRAADLLFPEYGEASRYHDAGKFGYVTISAKDRGRWIEDHFLVKNLPERIGLLDRKRDSYLTQAEFKRRSRAMVNFLRISNSFVDLDTYKMPIFRDRPKERLKEELPWAVRIFCSDNKIPSPNLILFSGQGIYLKWIYDRPIPFAAFAKWNLVQRELIKRLAPMGADPNAVDVARVLRIEGTVNTKSGLFCEVVHDDGGSWNFDDLADEVLPLTGEQLREIREDRRTRREIKNMRDANPEQVRKTMRRVSEFTIQTLAADRLWDIQSVIVPAEYGPDGIPNGSHMRDAFLFQGAVCIAKFAKNTVHFERELREYHRNIAPSMPWKDARSSTSTIRKKLETSLKEGRDARYRMMKNDRLVEFLMVSPETQRQCKTIISKEIKRERDTETTRKTRREQGVIERGEYEAKRKGELERNIQRARELRDEGMSRKEIAAVMGKSAPMIDVYLRGSRQK